MKYDVKKLKNSALQVIATADTTDVEKYEKQAFKELQQKVSVKGFRKGHAPKEAVIKEVGEHTFQSEKMNIAINSMFYEILVKEKINPVTQPKADLKKEDPLTIEFQIDLFPEVPSVDISRIKVKEAKIDIKAKEVEAAIENFQKAQATWKVSEKKAVDGNRVEMDFEGFVDDKPFDGGKAKHYPLVIGSNQFIPGFEEQLVGVKKGDEKDIEVTFPKEYQAENLKGKKAIFKINVHEVSEQVLPEVDDAFIEKFTQKECKNKKELEEKIKVVLEGEKRKEDFKRIQQEISEIIIKNAKIDLPLSMIESEKNYILSLLEKDLEKQKMTLEQYREMRKTTEEKMSKEAEVEAVKRLKLRLSLQQYAKDTEIEVKDTEIAQEIKGMNLPKDIDKERVEANVRTELLIQKSYMKIEEEVMKK